jgi:hypothetical protein
MEDHANHKHTIMLVQNKNTEDTRQDHSHDDHHRASLYVDINHSWYLSSHHSTKPDKYDGSARVSLQEGTHPAVPHSTGQIELFESHTKLYKETIPLATTPLHRKTSPQDMSISMYNHSFSPTVTTATLKRYKHKDSHIELLTKVYMKKTIKFGNSHKTSTPQDQLKMVEYEAYSMESLTQFHMKRSPNVLTTNMMNHISGCLNKSHQVQKKLQYKVKTSSDADATKDPDLARRA